jgi:hypothetical protein
MPDRQADTAARREELERIRELLRFVGAERYHAMSGPARAVELWQIESRRLLLAWWGGPEFNDEIRVLVFDGDRSYGARELEHAKLDPIEAIRCWLDRVEAPRALPQNPAQASPEDLGW